MKARFLKKREGNIYFQLGLGNDPFYCYKGKTIYALINNNWIQLDYSVNISILKKRYDFKSFTEQQTIDAGKPLCTL